MESLHTYLDIATKACAKRKVKLSDDLIAFVAEYIMRADIKYNKDIGSLFNFRASYINAAIRNFFSLQKRKKSKQKEVNDFCFQSDLTIKKLESVPDHRYDLINNIEYEDTLAFIKSKLTDLEYQILIKYVENNRSLYQTGQELGILSHNIYKKLEKIRKKLEEYKDVLE